MNRNVYQAKDKSSLSRIFRFGKLQGVTLGLALVVSISGTAIAQYPGGGGTSSYPGGTRPSYGSKGAVIGGVAAGVAGGRRVSPLTTHPAPQPHNGRTAVGSKQL